MNRVRKFVESILYVGLKPDSSIAPINPPPRPSLSAWVERFLAGTAPNDPLYLTNRSFGQHARLILLITVPCLAVVAVLYFALSQYFAPRDRPQQQLTPAQIAAKMLPNLDKNIQVQTNHDVEVTDVTVEHSDPVRLTGTVRNDTDRVYQDVEIVFDLTDVSGSKLGAVSTKIPRLEAHGSAPFSFPVAQSTAAFALVREVDLP